MGFFNHLNINLSIHFLKIVEKGKRKKFILKMHGLKKMFLIQLNGFLWSIRFDVLNGPFVFPGVLSFLYSPHQRINLLLAIADQLWIIIKIANRMDSDRRLVLPFELLHFIILNYFDSQSILVNSNIVISEVHISILAHVD